MLKKIRRLVPALALLAALVTLPVAAYAPPLEQLPDTAAAVDAGTEPMPAHGLSMEDVEAVKNIVQIDGKQVADAFQSGKILLGILALLLAAVKFLRGPGVKILAWLGRLIPGVLGTGAQKFSAWLTTKQGGWALNIGVSAIGVVTSFATGALTLTPGNVLSAVAVGAFNTLAAAGTIEAKKDVAVAQAAGVAAAKDPGPTLGA